MPRTKNLITRTIVGTEVTLLALDIVTGEVQNETYTMSGKFKDSAALLKAVQKKYDTDTLKHVSIVDSASVNQLYGMDESDFIRNAFKLDENRKPITEDEAIFE